jgi:hypothetical protein
VLVKAKAIERPLISRARDRMNPGVASLATGGWTWVLPGGR